MHDDDDDDDEAAFDAELAALADSSVQVGSFLLPQWVKGGSVAQPAIDGYVCDDPRAMAFALGVMITTGVSIPDYDGWLTSIGECGAQRELRDRRQLAEDALQENKQDVMRGHLEWMYLRRRAIELEETVLLPLVQGEENRKARSSEGGNQAAKKRRDAARAAHADWVEAARGLLVLGRQQHELSAILAKRFNVSTKQMRTTLQEAGLVRKREVK